MHHDVERTRPYDGRGFGQSIGVGRDTVGRVVRPGEQKCSLR